MFPIHTIAVSKRINAFSFVSEYRDGYGWVLPFKVVQIFQTHRIPDDNQSINKEINLPLRCALLKVLRSNNTLRLELSLR